MYVWIGGATGLLVVFLGLVAAVTRRSTKRRNSAQQDQLVARLREEIEGLKQENALLRSEQQRPLSLGAAAGAIRGQLLPAAADSTDQGDEAWAAVTDATVLQATIVSVCQDLQTAIHHVQTQLTTGIPVSELDRRATDRQPRPRLDTFPAACPTDVTVVRTGSSVRVPGPVSGPQEAAN
jgi:hypothetical protein